MVFLSKRGKIIMCKDFHIIKNSNKMALNWLEKNMKIDLKIVQLHIGELWVSQQVIKKRDN